MRARLCPNAVARLQGDGAHAKLRGIVKFFQRENGVMIEAEVVGLPETETGFFGFHIHEGVSCSGDGFPDTGAHFNPGIVMHPKHAGDLPPLMADHGSAYLKVFTDRFHVEEVIGRTVIIHDSPDDFHSQPSGNAGVKIACGVIRKV